MSTALDVSEELKKQFNIRRANPSDMWGIDWGLALLNKITGGIQKGELAVLIADSNVGKSSLAGRFAETAAIWLQGKNLQDKREVRVVSLEMLKGSFLSRLACSDSGVSRNRVKNGFINNEQADAYLASLDRLGTLPIRFLDNKEIPDLEALKQALTAEIEGRRTAYWIIDHFHIAPKPRGMGNDASGHEALANELTKICRQVAPGLVLAQMTKLALQREDKRPQMMDVRYSSLLCNNADIVLGLYRDDRYTKWPSERQHDPRPAELEIIKSRDGGTGTAHLLFLPDQLKWVEKTND